MDLLIPAAAAAAVAPLVECRVAGMGAGAAADDDDEVGRGLEAATCISPFPAPPPVVGAAGDENKEAAAVGGGLERGAFMAVGIMDGAVVGVEEVDEAGEESWL